LIRLCRTARARLALIALTLAAMSTAVPVAGASGSGVPFTDPSAAGYIGFCDLAGHNVTSGTLDGTPFVWKAVSSVQPPKAYQGGGQNADLNIYQARQDLDPGDWTGEGMIGDTQYAATKEPTAVATYKDISLKSIVLALPPMWDGMYALRMQFGKTGFGIYGATYPMTVIQVIGNRWHVISGGLVNCSTARGISLETLTGVASQLPPKPIKNETAPTAPASARALSSAPADPAASSKPSPGQALTPAIADPISAPLTLAHSGGGVSRALLVVGGLVLLLLVGLGGLALGRRRRPRT
jgi:hypothetical protein